ncbi:MAG TPA: ABC transporter substrate-binding protein [Geobacteraceae bacterium]|nr:ABC transporter substrate-binding protein [Geobacteraceae bacterium]
MGKYPEFIRQILFICLIALCLQSLSVLAEEKQPGAAGLSKEEALRLGERIYREGVLPSGEPVTAVVQGDIPIEGTMFSCESCHMRSGLGSYEGGVLTTPTTGKYLYRPLTKYRQLTPAEEERAPTYLKPVFQALPIRPAYTDETLAAALRGGIDPAGRRLHSVMPCYLLNNRDMTILVYYLRSLSTEPSPGVTDTTLRFATVITDDVTAEEREAMLTPLENYVQRRNSQAKKFETRAKYGVFAEPMDLTYRRLSLARWKLKGSPETWRGQMEEYYRKEPVFALLGGITNGEWRPVHEFSEEHRIPCIFPITDFPVISGTDWYTLYFSKGFYQEGEAAARFLGTAAEFPPEKTVVQIFRDTGEGRAFSTGFQETWRDLGRQPPVNRILQAGETITQEFLQHLADKDRPAVILLWVGPEVVQALEIIAANANKPEMVYVSSSLMKQGLGKLPEKARDFTYITYPYGLSPVKIPSIYTKSAKRSQQNDKVLVNDRRIPAKIHSLSLLLTDAFMMMGNDFYRDRFLDVIGMQQDRPQPYTDYERLSFGPGQRYASKGCYIMQLTHGANPTLVKKSDWVIH